MEPNLTDKLRTLLVLLSLGESEEVVYQKLVEIIHTRYKKDMLTLFLQIQELDKLDMQKKLQTMYLGLQDGMHNSAILAKLLLESKTSRAAKEAAAYYFKSDNIASLINIMKAYFPNGKADGCSNAGRWFYDSFVEQLMLHKHKYLEGGSSYNWVTMYGHEDYINLILKINNDKGRNSK